MWRQAESYLALKFVWPTSRGMGQKFIGNLEPIESEDESTEFPI